MPGVGVRLYDADLRTQDGISPDAARALLVEIAEVAHIQ